MQEPGRSKRARRARSARAAALSLVSALAVASAGCVALGGPGGQGTNYLEDYAALPEPGFMNAVIEIPAGTNEKWELSRDGREFGIEQVGGAPRVVRYLAYPANYGMVPRTLQAAETGGDGDPLDVVLLGSAVARGSVLLARPVGVLHLLDEGERDDKLIAVPTTGPLADVSDLAALERELPGAVGILETWFVNYKGPGRTQLQGVGDAAAALRVIQAASASFERAVQAAPAPVALPAAGQ